MTKRESAIISAYTGILCGPFDAMHAYIEEIMGRPVFTHELAQDSVVAKIKDLAKPDLLALIQSIED